MRAEDILANTVMVRAVLGNRSSPNDSEWKICPVCEGSGKMDAEVTIKWKPSKMEKK